MLRQKHKKLERDEMGRKAIAPEPARVLATGLAFAHPFLLDRLASCG